MGEGQGAARLGDARSMFLGSDSLLCGNQNAKKPARLPARAHFESFN
jgi:hypothetical protein